jgi:hypothetical protein
MGEDDDVSNSNQISIYPQKTCPVEERGTWSMGISYEVPDISLASAWATEKIAPRFPMVYNGSVTIGGHQAVIFNEVESEAKLIERKDQKNYHWTVQTNCGDKNFTIGYVDYLDKMARERARKNPAVPRVFKDFIAGIHCEKN